MKSIVKSLMIVLLGSIFVVGCGRKGALELPSSMIEKTTQETFSSKNKLDKPFILDRLIQ
ncbi:LPS translocon maturation chaperone LptM [Bartonella senegalensis]|uniref:LPS translocon maturation chaperone LptM n=1 Tax=Bartonella senegalensis TaxID=1468418 RepID=UPI000553461E|nr:lipoprotein [Bartonella senegalensis]